MSQSKSIKNAVLCSAALVIAVIAISNITTNHHILKLRQELNSQAQTVCYPEKGIMVCLTAKEFTEMKVKELERLKEQASKKPKYEMRGDQKKQEPRGWQFLPDPREHQI